MALSIEQRGILETAVDSGISDAAVFLSIFREPKIKKAMMFSSENDFATGIVWGMVLKSLQFQTAFRLNRQPTREEIGATMELLIKRMPEIREGLFKKG